WDQVFDVVRRCFEALRTDCPRISCSIKVDYRAGATGRLEGKVRRVQELVHVPLKTGGPT
ncbi:MAG: thiamine-binding protein, partial [Gemmataceae bacterium]|nr:thiamine-binding protein [Gemmataceae bacterium]